MQQIRPRCTGALIACGDGSLSTHGQWGPSQSDGKYASYRDSEGLLKSITFIWFSTGETVERFVQEILVNEDESNSIERQRFSCNNPNILLSIPLLPPLLTFQCDSNKILGNCVEVYLHLGLDHDLVWV